jgi:hypothetical protein
MQSEKEIEDLLKVSGLLHPETKEEKRIRLNLKNMVYPAGINMAKYHAYRIEFQRLHPNMKPSRLQRKVAQKFNIKLID